MSNRNEKLMMTKDAAAYFLEGGFPVTAGTLEVWRCKKRGPKYKKINGRVFYEKSWLDEFRAGIEVKVYDPAMM